ncbi:MAG: TetR family transcriptional regulator, partial [Ilumatobacteraceae bacterium]|nr:TetR family transcriptional regulator [Ilumatobacteraceae bacterium]
MASGKVSVRAKTAMPSTSAPVTARGARTRAALVKAARALFEKNGFLETNVGDIARRARVAHGTFYTYFNSKEEIFSEVVESLQADMQRIASAEPAIAQDGSISSRIERANRGYIRAYETNARMMAVLEQVATFNPRLAQMRRATRTFWRQRSSEAIK